MRDAKQWTKDGMRACIPPGCPLPFTSVLSARFTKDRDVVAKVEMFDGLPGVIEISQQGRYSSWSYAWKDLPGGDANWNGTRWERVNKIIQPKQLELELEEANAK